MNRIFLIPIVAVLVISACQKGGEQDVVQQQPAASNSVSNNPAPPPADTTTEPEHPKEVVFRTVRANVYLSEEAIQILVPEDIDVSSGRLIEYEQGEDGRYYFVSLIPQ